jgi:hypothetical protein
VELTTDQKGSIAEAAIVFEAAKLGVGIFKPLSDGERYDLILDVRSRLVRVQCKWAVRRGNVIVVTCCSRRRTANGFDTRTYTKEEVDAIAAYCREVNRCYLIPIARVDGRRALQLRLAPTLNNQQLGVNWADDFDFAATIRRLGAVAQLGERPDGIRKVRGSIPLGSTL